MTFVEKMMHKIIEEEKEKKERDLERKKREAKEQRELIKKLREKEQLEADKAVLRDYVEKSNESRSKGLESITDEIWNNHKFEVDKNKRYVDEWLRDIIKPNKSEATYKQYKSAIRQFTMWNERENDQQAMYKFKKRAFMRYQNWLAEQGLSKKSIDFKRSVVSSYCNYLEVYISEEDDKYETFKNFVKGTESADAKASVYEKIPVTYEEFVKVNEFLLRQKKYLLHAIWTTLFYTGNRITEVMQLKLEDLKAFNKDAKVNKSQEVRGKGRGKAGKVLHIRLTKECVDAMNLYVKHKRPKEDNGSPYVFFGGSGFGNESGEFVSQDTIRLYFQTIISPILGRRINPHLLRGSFATYLLSKGKSLEVVKELLNHNDISVTNKYYDLRNKSQLVDEEMDDFVFGN